MASSSRQKYSVVHEGAILSPNSIAHKTMNSADCHPNGVCSAEFRPPGNNLTHTVQEETSENKWIDYTRPISNTPSIREENESFQRVQPSGPMFSITNSVYDFPASAAIPPGTQTEVLQESSEEQSRCNNIERERRSHLATSVSEAEESDRVQSSHGEREIYSEENTNSLGHILRDVSSNPKIDIPKFADISQSLQETSHLATSTVLQALQQALALAGNSDKVPASATKMLSEVLAKPVRTPKDARARRGAILRYKRATEVLPSAPAESHERFGSGSQTAGTKRKMSEEEIEEKRIKNRASVQACRHRKRVRKNELQAEQNHYKAEHKALRDILWSLDIQDSGVSLPLEIERLLKDAKDNLNMPKYPDE